MTHIVKAYDQDLQKLRKNITFMAEKVFKQVQDGMQAFITNDNKLAQEVSKKDIEINNLNEKITQSSIEIIALRQPMAYDLRMCVSSFKIANNLERMGDVAKGFNKRYDEMNQIELESNLINYFDNMFKVLAEMNDKVFSCFKNKPIDLAIQVYKMDDIVDKQYNEIFSYLLNQYPKKHPKDYTSLVKIILVLKGIERIGDHLTNIAESIYYIFKAKKLKDDLNK